MADCNKNSTSDSTATPVVKNFRPQRPFNPLTQSDVLNQLEGQTFVNFFYSKYIFNHIAPCDLHPNYASRLFSDTGLWFLNVFNDTFNSINMFEFAQSTDRALVLASPRFFSSLALDYPPTSAFFLADPLRCFKYTGTKEYNYAMLISYGIYARSVLLRSGLRGLVAPDLFFGASDAS